MYGVLLLLIVGCERGAVPESGEADTHSPVLRRGNGGDPETLDPSVAEDVHAFSVLHDLYEGLVTVAADGSLIPGAASDWELSADKRRYTFHLRQDARWSNGKPVIADEFVASFRRTLSPDSTSSYAFLLNPILHAKSVANGERPVTELGIRALDTATLEIELTSPASYFPGILAMPIAFPLYGGEGFDPQQFSDPDQFVGNGPYLLKDRQPGSLIRLERSAEFRNAAEVSVRFVDYFPIENPDTELNMFRAGELDITASVPPAQIEDLRQRRPGELRISPGLALYYLAFDLTEPPMDDVALRQALSMAIDREALVQILGRGEQAAFGIVPSGVAGHEVARHPWQTASRLERQERAQALYAIAGYGEATPLRFTLMYDVGDVHETVALAVVSMWRDVLGAEVTLDKREWKYFLDTREKRAEWQVMRFAWFGDYNDASTFLDIFRSGSAQNLPGFGDRDYDDLLDRGGQAADPAIRAEIMNEAENLLLNAYPVIPLYFFVNKHLVSPAVRNYQDNILDVHLSQYIELTGPQ
jgi:oligopeptide transport system substrate-binding protein